jgi:hypothetical protein
MEEKMPAEASERRKDYLKRKKSGCCPRCGDKLKKTSKFKYCDSCREYFREYNSKISKVLNKARKALYEKRKKMKCCPRCGISLGKKYDKTICVTCLDKQYKYNYSKSRPKKAKAAKKK